VARERVVAAPAGTFTRLMSTLQGPSSNVESFAASAGSHPINVSMVLPLLLRERAMTLEDLAYVLEIDAATAHYWQRIGWPADRVVELTFTFGTSVDALVARQHSLQNQLEHQRSPKLVDTVIFRDDDPVTRLESAGMVRLHHVRPSTYELYCMACGRGIGRDGVLISQPRLPRLASPCRTCHGTMFAREILTGNAERAFDALLRESYAA
jgi:hypothetical protein